MDSPAVGGDVSETMCKRNSKGEEKQKVRQQATGDGFRKVRRQKGQK